MFVLAIGLLGVASLLPVGQFQVRKGSDDMRATELAERAFGTMESYGLVDPARWLTAADDGAGNDLFKFFDAADPVNGSRMAWTVAAGSTATRLVATPPSMLVATPTSNRPFSVSAAPFDITTGLEDLTGCVVEFVRGKLRGARRRVNAYNYNSGTGTFDFNGTGQVAPFSAAPDVDDVFVVIRNQAFAIDPSFIAVNGAVNNTLFADGVPRVTLTRTPGGEIVDTNDPPRTFGPMDEVLAEEVFVSDDAPDFSWLATFVPGEGGLYTRDYTVSVAVFRKRGILLPIADQQRAVNLAFAVNGPNLGGGIATLSVDLANLESLFKDRNGNGTIDNFERDKSRFAPQQWLLVSNRAPQATVNPQDIAGLVYRWYRIGSVGNPYLDNGAWAVDVQLAGADWDTTVLGGGPGPPTAMGTVYDDLLAVFQRPLRVKALPVGTTN